MRKHKQKITYIILLLLTTLARPLQAAYTSRVAYSVPAENMNNPLISTAQNGDVTCLNYLVSQDMQPDNETKDRDYEGKTLVELFKISKIGLQIIKYIGCQKRDGHKALILSVGLDQLDCVKQLVMQGANIHAKDNGGYTALHWSARYGHLACLKCLVAQGAHLDGKSCLGRTALHLSALHGDVNCVQYLVVHGAELHAKDKNGDTALILSQQEHHDDCVKYLKAQKKAPSCVIL